MRVGFYVYGFLFAGLTVWVLLRLEALA